MSKNKDDNMSKGIVYFLYDLIDNFFESTGIGQSKMYKEILTNIFNNNDFGPLKNLISSDMLMFHAILIKESDRGTALMAASYLEDFLEKLLKNFG